MTLEGGRPDWRAILTHEAGHAIAALVLQGATANIRLRGAEGVAAHRASYDLPDREDGFKPNPVDPLTRVMVYAAGAIAEALLLNISRSAGFAGDLRKINRVRDEFARKASTAYIAAQALSDGAHARAIAEVHEAQTRLAEVELEISSDYPRTRSMLEECRAALQALAEFAIARLSELEHLDGTMIDGTILVTSDEVQSLWNSHSSGTA